MRQRVFDPATDGELARYEAQKLAFAPLVFQACRAAREVGLFRVAYRSATRGVTPAEIVEECGVSRYAAELLLEASLAAGLLAYEEPRFVLTKTGVFWEKDELTRVNADFCHHVCYRGAFRLDEALRQGIPAGLPELGDFSTVYEGLSRLAPDVKKAWLAFDHFYSDGIFGACLDAVLHERPRHVVDIGGNTGRFTRLLVSTSPDLRVTLVDLPSQIMLAKDAMNEREKERVSFVAANMLDPAAELPSGADVYWMSQFLDCFAEDEIVSILSRARRAMKPESRLFIVETFWNEQRFEAARYCVIATSLYFACIANGNSRMYHSGVMRSLVERAGLTIDAENHRVGVSHSLLTCRARS